MTSQLLGRTHHSEVESLTASGLPIHEMLQQIRLELRKWVGDEHALLFAEPNANPETGHIQWYASTEGTARRLNELVGEERQAAEARLAQLTREILARAARLRESSDPQDQQIDGYDIVNLQVICPTGQKNNDEEFETRQACNGDLGDYNFQPRAFFDVSWDENAPPGKYRVLAKHIKFVPPRSAPTPVALFLVVGREIARTGSGTADGTWKEVFTFDLPLPAGAPQPQPPRKP